jgi:hypothetical protein
MGSNIQLQASVTSTSFTKEGAMLQVKHFCLALALCATGYQSAQALVATPSTDLSSLDPNDTFAVTVSAEDDETFVGFQFDVTFGNILEVVSVDIPNPPFDTSSGGVVKDNGDGTTTVQNIAGGVIVNDVTAPQTLATLNLKANDPGATVIAFSQTGGSTPFLIDASGQEVFTLSPQNQDVNVVPLPGAAVFLLSGLVGLGAYKRWRSQSQQASPA